MKEEEMMEIADLMHRVLVKIDDPAEWAAVRREVVALTSRYPLPR
jgi:glycine/serine hydroxymethyltransferase